MFVPYTIVNPLTIVRVSRLLSRPGEVLVRTGEPVEPAHIVAESLNPPDFRIVDIVRELDIPVRKLKSALQVKRGDVVAAGDLLATRGGLGGRSVRAPIDGTIVGSGRGRLLLEAEPVTTRLNALVPGTVVDVTSSRGVMIETVGAHIQATWGNGREAYGVLRVVVRAPRHPIRPKHIDVSAQGAILVGGSRIDEETLEQAIEMQVRGIIVGGIAPSLMARLEALPFPVVTTEGIGEIPMCRAIFDLLRSLNGREAAVSARVKCCWGASRPYIVVPMPTQAGTPVDPEAPLAIGSRVRAVRGQYRGMSGTVTDIPTGMSLLETGGRFQGLHVDFGGKDQAFIPLPNVERLL